MKRKNEIKKRTHKQTKKKNSKGLRPSAHTAKANAARRRPPLSAANLVHYQEIVKLMSDSDLRDQVFEVLRNPFEVVVVATMSAGKSTLLNSLIGKELVPSANESCTARVVRVEDHDGEAFKVRLSNSFSDSKAATSHVDLESWEPATPKILARLNESDEDGIIEIVGDIKSIDNLGAHLVVYDTPGPNNSRDPKHAQLTKKIIEDGNYGLVLYVLNATQIGINDDHGLLKHLKQIDHKQDSEKQFVFILNKADQFDEERGESLVDTVNAVREYLIGSGFLDPIILVACSNGALLARKLSANDALSRRERGVLHSLFEDYKENPTRYLKASQLPAPTKRRAMKELKAAITGSETGAGAKKFTIPFASGEMKISQADLDGFLVYTGIRSIELLLEDQLLKEGLPSTTAKLKQILEQNNLIKLANWI